MPTTFDFVNSNNIPPNPSKISLISIPEFDNVSTKSIIDLNTNTTPPSNTTAPIIPFMSKKCSAITNKPIAATSSNNTPPNNISTSYAVNPVSAIVCNNCVNSCITNAIPPNIASPSYTNSKYF